ncbi:MAG: hypothetical protein F6K17_27610 [Okeania sp. SIO3C4]|nr:hypothetical protein [Okeania sp. SIO3C4]
MTAQNLTTNHQLENNVVETYPLLKAQAKELEKILILSTCFNNRKIKKSIQ